MAKRKKRIINKKENTVDLETKVGKPWFRKRRGLLSPDLGWGWMPISWQGYLVLLLFLAINVFSVFYFDLVSGTKDSVLKFLTVLILSLLAFSLIAIKKTHK